jgi:Ca2+-binding EF-hand superfamily protein
MIALLMKGDTNKDGKITAEELPEEFKELMPRVDLNRDGVIDAEELRAMEEGFRKRREGSRESARDPIVYGVAAGEGAFVIRTGTRLFCVRGE